MALRLRHCADGSEGGGVLGGRAVHLWYYRKASRAPFKKRKT